MLDDFVPGCQRPPMTAQKAPAIEAPVAEKAPVSSRGLPSATAPEAIATTRCPHVGEPAPQFTASAYLGGKFVEASLSEYMGKWVLLCFYPGDFTFV
jgi:hypothetical protein